LRVVFLRAAIRAYYPPEIDSNASAAPRRGYVDTMTPEMRAADWTFAASNADRALEARNCFLDYVRAWAVETSDLDAARMVYAELVGNVVRHAPGPIWVGL